LAKRRPAASVVDAFAARLRGLEQTRRNIERLCGQSLMGRRDAEHVYGAIFIAACAAFEAMLEDLFLKLLTARVTCPRSVRSKVSFGSDAVAKDVVFGKRPYLSWVPYEETEKRAEALFYGGRPFTRLTASEKSQIKKTFLVRNAIAHKEGHARRRFDKEIISGLTLAPRQRTPTAYLRSLHSMTPNVTRYEQLMGDLVSIARNLVA
jgi:hypothetical protein